LKRKKEKKIEKKNAAIPTLILEFFFF